MAGEKEKLVNGDGGGAGGWSWDGNPGGDS